MQYADEADKAKLAHLLNEGKEEWHNEQKSLYETLVHVSLPWVLGSISCFVPARVLAGFPEHPDSVGPLHRVDAQDPAAVLHHRLLQQGRSAWRAVQCWRKALF